MGLFRGVPRWLRYALLLGLLVPLVLTLILVATISDDREEGGGWMEISPSGNTRKPLVVGKKDVEDLRFQVRELEEIRASVRNELRLLEQRHLQLSQSLDSQRNALALTKKDLTSAKVELQITRDKMLRTFLSDNRSYVAPTHPSRKSAPVFVLPVRQAPDRLQNVPDRQLTDGHYRRCTYSLCFDFSRCLLTKPFLVYVYSEKFFSLKDSTVYSNFVSSLQQKGSYTFNPNDACLYVAIVGPLKDTQLSSRHFEEQIHSLPHWRNEGANHVLVDLSDHNDSAVLSRKISLRKAITAQSHLSPTYRSAYDIVTPPAPRVAMEPIWKGISPFLPALRPILLYFEGRYSQVKGASHASCVSVEDLDLLQKVVGEKESVHIRTECSEDEDADVSRTVDEEWRLCGQAENRVSLCAKSTFALIVGGSTENVGSATYLRLAEALRCGSIPIIVGAEVSMLPFHSVISWKRAAIVLPCERFPDIHYIIRSLEHNTILVFRQQGRFLWETYFSSPGRILDSVVSIVRSNVRHPPPPAPEYRGKNLLVIPGRRPFLPSPTFQYNFSIYTEKFWNSPPGPFYMYPLTPFKSAPMSGSQYVGMEPSSLASLPPHVVQGAGITGPFFERYLMGNVPQEQFTVVMLTYQRNEVLIEALERMEDVAFLSKIVVVWNNREKLPVEMKWPNISVPIEVVQPEQNSLNNRFLPFVNIETEAVLSIDDDVHLRPDEIQFAFRVWREARDRIVGFPGRFHNWDVRHGGWLYNSNYTCELSMVLTGAAFFHKYYSYLYTYWMPQEVRALVDEYMNCEDIAMNFLVSHMTRKPPLKVTTRWTFHCPSCPESLSSSEEHFNERHVCINKLTEIYGYMPLLYTQFRLDSVLFKTRIPSILEKCYSLI